MISVSSVTYFSLIPKVSQLTFLLVDALDQVFNSLFYGSGSWLGLLLFIILILGLVLKWKYSGALMLPIAVFLGIDYLGHDGCQWHAIIMFLTATFILIYMAYQIKER